MTERLDRHNFESVRNLYSYLYFCICYLHSCYNFALVLYENALIFSQSEARYFFFTLLMMHLLSSAEPQVHGSRRKGTINKIVNITWQTDCHANNYIQIKILFTNKTSQIR